MRATWSCSETGTSSSGRCSDCPSGPVSLKTRNGRQLGSGKHAQDFDNSRLCSVLVCSGSSVILRSGATKNSKPLREYYVYILTNETHRLYVGVTGDLRRRMYQHKNGLTPGFASRYNLRWLAYYETTTDVQSAIAREKQIKGWKRHGKVALIELENPGWVDLSAEWSEALDSSLRSE